MAALEQESFLRPNTLNGSENESRGLRGRYTVVSQYTHQHHRICIVFMHRDTYMRYRVSVNIYYIKYFML